MSQLTTLSAYDIVIAARLHTSPYLVIFKPGEFNAEYPSDDLAMHESGKSVPFWKTEDLYSVMRKVVKSGAVSHQTLCKEKGMRVIDSLIKHNIIHLRPTKRNMGKNRIKGGVVTAESACGLYAMDHMLKQKETEEKET